MKNKKLIYILVPLAILVWGVIFYKVFMSMEDKGTPSLLSYNANLKSAKKDVDTFVLVANYRDPFLSGQAVLSNHPSFGGSAGNRQNVLSIKPTPIPPDVRYFGLIASPKNKNKIGLIKIQGYDFLLKEGELTKADIKVLKLFKDSVIVLFQKNKFAIRRT